MSTVSSLSDLLARPIPEIASALASGEVTSVALTTAYLDRITALDPQYSAYISVTADTALKQAAACDEARRNGRLLGVLHGVPVAVKDLCETDFAPTSNGMAMHRLRETGRNAEVVTNLIAAGAVVLGKLAMAEGACSSHHPLMPVPKNPWGELFRVGSSSSGSGVAVAAALTAGAVGSDTGGSIRFPSAYCGVTGFKPSRGLVSVNGVCAMATSLDHIGPMASTAEGCALMLQAMTGQAATSLPTSVVGKRFGYVAALLETGLDAEVTASYRALINAASAVGMELIECVLPDASDLYEVWSRLCAKEVAIGHAETFPAQREEYGAALAALADQGLTISDEQYARDCQRQVEISGLWQALLTELDCLALPIHATVAPLQDNALGAPSATVANPLLFTAPGNITGVPALALPITFDSRGCPIGMQIMGAMGTDFALLGIGATLQNGPLPPLLR
jgi:amidase